MLRGWIEFDALLVVLTALAILGSGRLKFVNHLVAVQGVIVSILPLLVEGVDMPLRAAFLTALTIGLKGWTFPHFLDRAITTSGLRREPQPVVGYTAGMLIGLALLGLAAHLGGRLALPMAAPAPAAVPAALFTMFAGLFLIVSRRTAIMQVLGYLVVENGIFVFGTAVAPGESFLVELGMLLDIFVAVFIMGLTILHLSRTLDTVETDRLQRLRERGRALGDGR
ncbi:MAG TPA: hydrogenase [bacterium]|nr:hydrogenase [bacterium]